MCDFTRQGVGEEVALGRVRVGARDVREMCGGCAGMGEGLITSMLTQKIFFDTTRSLLTLPP